MAEKLPETGISDLDADLRVLFEAPQGQLSEYNANAPAEASLPTLATRIPSGILRLAYWLGSDDTFASLLEQSEGSSHAVLERAHDLFRSTLPQLATHSAVRSLQEKPAAPKSYFKTIGRVVKASSFVGIEGKLSPAMRLAFFDDEDDVVLDSTGEWDDWSFVARAIFSHLANEMEAFQDLAKANRLTPIKDARILENIVKTEKALGRLRAALLAVQPQHASGDGLPQQTAT